MRNIVRVRIVLLTYPISVKFFKEQSNSVTHR